MIDASFGIDVEVTARHIASGRRFDNIDCPIANAINETLWASGTRFQPAAVGGGAVLCTYLNLVSEVRYMASLPEAVTDWVRAFDTCRNVEPISFSLTFHARAAVAR